MKRKEKFVFILLINLYSKKINLYLNRKDNNNLFILFLKYKSCIRGIGSEL